MWKKRYAGHMSSLGEAAGDLDAHFAKLRTEITRIYQRKQEYVTLRKYFDYVIDHEIALIRQQASNGVDANTNADDHSDQAGEQKENNKPMPVLKIAKLNIDTIVEHNKMPATTTTTLPMSKQDIVRKMGLFDLVHLMRAHSKNNNVADNATEVADAAFEIAASESSGDASSSRKQLFTNLCATCGHTIINLIDVESGRIVKRFNDDYVHNGVKEACVV